MIPGEARSAGTNPGRRRWAAWVALPFALALVTLAARSLHLNETTAGFLYLVLVLGLAAWGGWAVGAVGAVAAMLCFNYFFFPPLGALTIEDPSNWVALLSFLAASGLASRLVASARSEAEEAERRRGEVETLYDLCFGLFATGQRSGSLGEAAARTLRALGAEAGTLLLFGPGGKEHAASVIGQSEAAIDRTALERVREWRKPVRVEEGADGPWLYLPLLLGGTLAGALLARRPLASRAVLEPAGQLLALAVERERLLREAAHLEAVRESEALKTALLRAVSHDLRTPLTSMRLEVESLEQRLAGSPEALASLRGLAEEQGRLTRRIDNLLALARLEAGLARPHPEPTPPASLFRAAREGLAPLLAGRPVEVRVEPCCPDLWADPSLALETVVNLLENAARAAPAGSALGLTAEANPERQGRVRLEVLDRGPGVPTGVRRRLQDPLGPQDPPRDDGVPGDGAAGGLGLQIAASFARASGGQLALLDRPGGGTIARLDLPAAPEPEEVEGFESSEESA